MLLFQDMIANKKLIVYLPTTRLNHK